MAGNIPSQAATHEPEDPLRLQSSQDVINSKGQAVLLDDDSEARPKGPGDDTKETARRPNPYLQSTWDKQLEFKKTMFADLDEKIAEVCRIIANMEKRNTELTGSLMGSWPPRSVEETDEDDALAM